MSRPPAPPEMAAILDVVVDQRKVVDQFQSRGRGKGLPRIATGRLTGNQADHGTQPLAAVGLDRTQHFVGPAKMKVHHTVVGPQAVMRDANHLL